ncbi:MAG: hypothetical protein IKS65_08625 [Bacteroidales bacterium]|nr:hypothetical protein [Bacteroidales bacterium]
MELIIIRGRQDDGKTTTATILHNVLIEYGASVKMLHTNENSLSVGTWMVDFQAVLDWVNKRIVIISEGDYKNRLSAIMDSLIYDYRPDIVVVCARSRDVDGSSYRMLTEKYQDLIKPENEFWTQFVDDYSRVMEVKRPIVELIINRIYNI